MEEKPKDFLDSTMITVSGLLLAGSVVLIGQSQLKSELLRYTLALSICCLCFSFLFAIWYKIRFPIRNSIFLNGLKELENHMSTEMLELFRQTIMPLATDYYVMKLKAEKITNKKELIARIEKYSNDVYDTHKPIFEKIALSYQPDFINWQKEAFDSPLEEKFAYIKYFIDVLAFKTRHFLFIIGLILFVTSLLSQILHGNAT
jgi:hypothetical protein